MSRSQKTPKNGQHKTPKKDKLQVYNLRGASPTGNVVVVTLEKRRRNNPTRGNLSPCLRGHQATRIIP